MIIEAFTYANYYFGFKGIFLFCLLYAYVLVFLIGPLYAFIMTIIILASSSLAFKLSVFIFRGQESMKGKTVLVTGAARGIGRQTAEELARRGARVLIADVNETLAKRTASEIVERTGNHNVEGYFLDLASLTNVRDFAKTVLEQEDRLDVLINNAGVLTLPNRITVDGIELPYVINYLGPFLLTNLLLPLLKRSTPARIVNVSSIAHSLGDVDLPMKTEFQLLKDLHPFNVYGNSKLALTIFSTELSRRLKGTGVTVNALHPGMVSTRIYENFPSWQYRTIAAFLRGFSKNSWEGAQTSLYLAISEDVTDISGKYFVDCKETEPSRHCSDPFLAHRLWEISEMVTEMKT